MCKYLRHFEQDYHGEDLPSQVLRYTMKLLYGLSIVVGRLVRKSVWICKPFHSRKKIFSQVKEIHTRITTLYSTLYNRKKY